MIDSAADRRRRDLTFRLRLCASVRDEVTHEEQSERSDIRRRSPRPRQRHHGGEVQEGQPGRSRSDEVRQVGHRQQGRRRVRQVRTGVRVGPRICSQGAGGGDHRRCQQHHRGVETQDRGGQRRGAEHVCQQPLRIPPRPAPQTGPIQVNTPMASAGAREPGRPPGSPTVGAISVTSSQASVERHRGRSGRTTTAAGAADDDLGQPAWTHDAKTRTPATSSHRQQSHALVLRGVELQLSSLWRVRRFRVVVNALSLGAPVLLPNLLLTVCPVSTSQYRTPSPACTRSTSDPARAGCSEVVSRTSVRSVNQRVRVPSFSLGVERVVVHDLPAVSECRARIPRPRS